MKDEANSTVQTEQRRLAAIMFTDIVGFSRQMGADEAHTLHLLGALDGMDDGRKVYQERVTDSFDDSPVVCSYRL